jgi:hypothetical protein
MYVCIYSHIFRLQKTAPAESEKKEGTDAKAADGANKVETEASKNDAGGFKFSLPAPPKSL